MISVPPLVPLKRYESLSWLAGRRAERIRLWMSTVWGRPGIRRNIDESKNWRQFDAYRNAASICDPAAISLWRALVKAHPKVILEFGTGFSTYVIASYARQMFAATGQRPAIISFDHDKRWFANQQRHLIKAELADEVRLVHGDIQERTYFGKTMMCYGAVESTLSSLNLEGPPDFVLVDGPPAKMVGGPGRRGSVQQAISLAKIGATILIHDALRCEEYDAIREFHIDKELPFVCHGIIPLWYGLAVCEKKLKKA